MKGKKFTLFWKKLLIMNLVLIVILVRIFGMIAGYLTRVSNNDSIFPQNTENGYPFFDSINCDISNLVKILETILPEKPKNDNNTEEIFLNHFMNSFKSKKCSFINKINICGYDKKCFNELEQKKFNKDDMYNLTKIYHYINENNLEKLTISNNMKLFQQKNQFFDNISKNIIEVESYYKLFSGYQSYLNIKLYEHNIEQKNNFDIIREITNYEDKVNNLFYLYSLLLKVHTIIYPNKISSNIDSIKNINQCLLDNEDQFTNKKSIFYKSEENLNKIQEILEKELFDIINCLPEFEKRFSYTLDIKAINIVMNVLLGKNENLSKNDKKIFNFFLKEFSESIKTIFLIDIKVRQKANIYDKYQPYFVVIFICISIGGLIIINRHFIKNRQYYNQGSRILEKYKRDRYNFMYNNKHRQYLEKLREMNEKKESEKSDNNINKIGINNNNIEEKNDKSKCTKEELEYIEKLSKEYKGDFIISK